MQFSFRPSSGTRPGTPWPFVVRQAATTEQEAVRQLRHLAYSRRLAYQPAFMKSLRQEDALDHLNRSVVFVAVDKSSGQVQGTVRLTSSLLVPDVLPRFVPAHSVTSAPFTFVDRFAVRPGIDQQVAPALMKTLWLWAGAAKTLALAALAPPILVKHYAKWGGLRVLGDGLPLNVPEHLKEPVYLVGASLSEAHARVLELNPTFERFVAAHHSDLELLSS